MGPKEISITSKVWIIFFTWYHYVHLTFITIPIQMVKHISQQTFLKDLCKKYPAGALTIYFKILCWYSFNMTKVNRCKCNIFSFFLKFGVFCFLQRSHRSCCMEWHCYISGFKIHKYSLNPIDLKGNGNERILWRQFKCKQLAFWCGWDFIILW